MQTTAPPAAIETETPAVQTKVPPPGETTAPPTEEPPPPTTPPPLVSGIYSGAAEVIQHPHSCCFDVAGTWDVLQTRDTVTGVITLTLSGMLAGTPGGLSTTIPGTGSPFTATSGAAVAGYDTTISFSGSLTYSGLVGTLTVGGDGGLPGGEASIWNISYTKIGGP